MEDQASPYTSRRICPTCKKPVEPGHKFCEACGAQMIELPTCSKCGTQFIAPVNFCDSCGAPVNPGVEPEPDDSQTPSHGEITGPVEDGIAEQEDEELTEQISQEIPGKSQEGPGKKAVPDKAETPRRYTKEIVEPDTDALLEQFGSEYSADETLASSRKQKPETVDDALLFSPGRKKVPGKLRINGRMLAGLFVLAAIFAVVYFIGLPALVGGGAHGNQTINITPLPTTVGTITPATVATTPVPRALAPMPTQTLPPGQKLFFQVSKNPVTAKISVTFAGSAGSGSIRSADIKVTHPDGSVSTGIIQPLKGVNEMTIQGSNEPDRVEITALMSTGVTYRVYDALVPG